MKEFTKFLGDFKSLSAILGKAVLLAPFITLLVNIGPPWPETARIPITALFQLFALMYVFEFWSKRGVSRLKQLFGRSLTVFVVVFVLYSSLFAFLTYPAPSNEHREAQGLIVQPRVASILNSSFTLNDAIEGDGYDPFRIWEPWTVHLVRIAILCSWLALFVSITLSLAAFNSLQNKRKAQSRNNRGG